ncbi:Retrotransposon Gag-like protein 9 [Labeo rohita]|uniref:Retrotransposon Gag-like protein 9 n=1 Tax=Labeo rohita TaxID=84645 RepID=A0ABQ8LYM2_LABRO|nr:Retrotransposon Gag-like protein 9 [Labeo rohita]
MAEEVLWGLWQGGRRSEQYVEEFLELANQLSWHDAALGVCFQLGLAHKTIHCHLPVCEYPLIELINLILYLNSSNFEVEEIEEDFKSRCPALSGTRHVVPAHSSPGTPTYHTNGSDCLPSPKRPHVLQSSFGFLSLEPPATAHSRTSAATLRSSPPALVAIVAIVAGPEVKATEAIQPCLPELFAPPWPPGLFAPP